MPKYHVRIDWGQTTECVLEAENNQDARALAESNMIEVARDGIHARRVHVECLDEESED